MSTIIVNARKMEEFRIRAGHTQNSLAKISGTNVSLISRLEAGGHTPRPTSAMKICKALDVKFDDLFTIIEKEEV